MPRLHLIEPGPCIGFPTAPPNPAEDRAETGRSERPELTLALNTPPAKAPLSVTGQPL